MPILDQQYLGNTLHTWLIACGITVASHLILKAAQWLVAHRLSKVTKATKTQLDDFAVEVIKKTRFFFLFTVSLYAGLSILSLSAATQRTVDTIIILALLLQSGMWVSGAISFWLGQTIKQRMEEDAASATTLTALGFISRLMLWAVVLLVSLDNVGIDITALVTGLGIGGIAVALALQSILSDLFASLSIVLDKPFVIGDFIIIDEHLGTVEYIGLKTTRLRSLSGEQIVFSNGDLLKSRIRNYKRMYERRVVFAVGITYQTPYEKIAAVSSLLRQIVESQPHVRFDRAHFKEYADSSLNYEVVYYVLSPDYNTYMDVQQAVNLETYRRFEHERIDFAYPTRTVYIHRPGPGTISEDGLEG